MIAIFTFVYTEFWRAVVMFRDERSSLSFLTGSIGNFVLVANPATRRII